MISPADLAQGDALAHAQTCLIDALAMSLQMRDPDTRYHCDRVAQLATYLARYCGLDPASCRQIQLAACFHDIGKIGIPDAVLLSPGRLDDRGREIIRLHSERGEQIFLATGRTDARAVAALIRAHHEAYDGSGYPDGLRGETIPLGARILAIADAYDAMTSQRPYRVAMSPQQALHLLDDQAAGQCDPYVLQRFRELLKREPGLS